MNNQSRLIGIAALAVAVIVIQVICSAAAVDYYLTQLTMAAYYSLVVMGLSLLMGYAGQISLGHAAFFAIGGYTTAVLTTINLSAHESASVIRLGRSLGLVQEMIDPYGAQIMYLSPWISLVAAVSIAGLVSLLIGIPVLRLKGHYLAMATLGFGLIIYRVLLGTALFGAADGISEIPPFPLFPGVTIAGGGDTRIVNYYVAWLLVIVILILLYNLIGSRIGRALNAIHGNEEAAGAMGVNTGRLKVRVFVLSAILASLAGVLLTHYNGGIGPSEAGIMKSVRYVAIVAVGGMAHLSGALFAGIILNFLSLRGYFGPYDDAVFGLILVLVMLFAPNGFTRLPVPDIVLWFREKSAWAKRLFAKFPANADMAQHQSPPGE